MWKKYEDEVPVDVKEIMEILKKKMSKEIMERLKKKMEGTGSRVVTCLPLSSGAWLSVLSLARVPGKAGVAIIHSQKTCSVASLNLY